MNPNQGSQFRTEGCTNLASGTKYFSTGVPFWDYCYFIKSSNLVIIQCKNHVSESQSAHNLLKVFINYKTSHLNIFFF